MWRNKKQRIVLYNRPWGLREDKELNYRIKGDFYLSTEKKYIHDAIAVVFHMPTLPREDKILSERHKKNGQFWVFWSMECEAHYEWQYQPAILDLFDIKATYKFDSDIPVPYIYPAHPKWLRRRPVSKTAFANAFISSNYDKSNRVTYLKELMSHINVDSYGKVLNNILLRKDKGGSSKMKMLSKYKFSLAFENARANDYVTEKFFDPLIAGSVPIYLGAPNVHEFAPGEHSYIDTNAFSSANDLADYLLELDKNDKYYEEYFRWKKLPIKEEFMRKIGIIKKNPLLRLCALLEQKI